MSQFTRYKRNSRNTVDYLLLHILFLSIDIDKERTERTSTLTQHDPTQYDSATMRDSSILSFLLSSSALVMASPIQPSVSPYQEDSTLTTTQKTITNSVTHNLPTSSVFFLPGTRTKSPVATASALVVRGHTLNTQSVNSVVRQLCRVV